MYFNVVRMLPGRQRRCDVGTYPALERDVEGEVWEGLDAARVVLGVLVGGVRQHGPLVALDVVVEVELLLVGVEVDVQLEAVVRPRAELHATLLQAQPHRRRA